MAGGLFSTAKLFGMTIRESANDGSDFTNPDADFRRLFLGEDGLLHVKDSAGAVTNPYSGGISSGTSFPGSPATNDLYYRTDLSLLFFYNGTRWLSTELFVLPFNTMEFITATNSGNRRPCLITPGSDVWLESFVTQFYVNAGGTALGASHKWVGVMRKNAASAVTIATVNIDSGASDVYRSSTVTINALQNNGTVQFVFDLSWTKTGTPGALLAATYLTYRIVAA